MLYYFYYRWNKGCRNEKEHRTVAALQLSGAQTLPLFIYSVFALL